MAKPVRKTEEDLRILRQRQANLTALSKHPSWPEFEAEVERRVQKIEGGVLNALGVRQGRFAKEVDQREIDYLRGFVSGIRWMVAVPVAAENSLEQWLRKQGLSVEGDVSE